jgi:hypothetical protein
MSDEPKMQVTNMLMVFAEKLLASADDQLTTCAEAKAAGETVEGRTALVAARSLRLTGLAVRDTIAELRESGGVCGPVRGSVSIDDGNRKRRQTAAEEEGEQPADRADPEQDNRLRCGKCGNAFGSGDLVYAGDDGYMCAECVESAKGDYVSTETLIQWCTTEGARLVKFGELPMAGGEWYTDAGQMLKKVSARLTEYKASAVHVKVSLNNDGRK